MTRIAIYDTTLRDGSQGEGVNFSLQDKLLITARLDDLGVDYIEGGYPLSNPKDAAYFRAVRELSLQHAKVAAFGMTRRRDIAAEDDQGMKALVAAGTPVVTIVGKTWDLHVHEVLGVSLDENLRMIADSVAFCAASVPEVVYDAEHFFDGFKRNPDYALRTLRAAADAGAAWIVLCDTNGGSLPEEVAEAVAAGRARDHGSARHPHPQRRRPGRRQLAGRRRHGARQVQGTINGIGERCGNADLCSVVANLALKYPGYEVLLPGKLTHLTEVSRYVYETANMNFRPDQPFVGASAFAHKGGMHVHGVRKNAASYEHIDPETVGNERQGAGQRAFGQVEHRREAGRVRPRTRLGAPGSRARPGAGPGERGLPVRGGRGVVRPAGRPAGRPAQPLVRAARLPRQRLAHGADAKP